MPPCVLCGIVAGDEPASITYQDELVLGLMTPHPKNPGHLLVIPKRHSHGFLELDEPTTRQLFQVGQQHANVLVRLFPNQGVSFVLHEGEATGQTIVHPHLHVIPRLPHDEAMKQQRPPTVDRAILEQHASRIRSAYPRTKND